MNVLLANASTAGSRLCSLLPPLSRSIVNRAVTRPVPQPRGIDLLLPTTAPTHPLTFTRSTGPIATPSDFLKAIGRSSETKLSVENWDEFWKISGSELKKAGLAVRDRRYILWCMEKFRQGLSIESFAHEPRPKKTVRGWGPAVQNGKRIRSRRIKHKKSKN